MPAMACGFESHHPYQNYRTLPDNGGLAQLARAPALHAGGHRFESDILHSVRLNFRSDERIQPDRFIWSTADFKFFDILKEREYIK